MLLFDQEAKKARLKRIRSSLPGSPFALLIGIVLFRDYVFDVD